MIEGLKVTIPAKELSELCLKRAEYHDERASKYQVNIGNFERDKIDAGGGTMHYSGGDPKRALQDRMEAHKSESAELRFIAAHLDSNESYLLDAMALQKLGIVKSPLGL